MDEQSLNELLECSVCLERLDHSSKVLPCQHTFCRRCLEEIISTKRELRCPECRTLVEVRVDDLPPNILLVRLLEGIKTRQTVDGSRSGRRNDAGSSSNGSRSRQGTQACAKALYCYEAKDHGDLSFKKGDIITLRKQVDENWYHGELSGQHGFFPASYVQVIIPLPAHLPQCKALYDFDLKDENEKDCLTFKKDEVLTVIKRVDDNWVEGKKGEKIGIFPISFVEMNEPAKIIINSKLNTPLTQHAGLSSDVTADKGSGDTSQTPPTSHLLGAGLASQMPQQKRHSFTASSHKSNQASQYHRRSLELSSSGNLVIASTSSSGVTRIPPPPVPVVSSRSESQTVMSKSDSTKTATESVPGATNGEAGVSTSSKVNDVGKSALGGGGGGVTAPVYVALYNYKPAKDDEVELKKGDYYTVSNKCQDGWFKGQCLKSGVVGVFPGNYVQLVRSNSAFRPVSGNTANTKNKSHFSPAVPNSSSSIVPNSEPSSVPLMTSSSGAVAQLTQTSVTDKHSARRRSLSPSVPSNTSPSRPSKSPASRSSMSPHRSSSSVSQKAPPINPRGAKIMTTSTSSTSSASYAAMSSSAFSKLTNHSSTTQSAVSRDITSGSRPLPSNNNGGSRPSSSNTSGGSRPSSSNASGNSKSSPSNASGGSRPSSSNASGSSRPSPSGASGGATVYVPPPHSSSHKSGNNTNLVTTAQGQSSRQASSLAAIKHSMSASANITPPNVVVGASGETQTPVPALVKEKKEKRDKEKISLVKRLVTSGKSKKSKSAISTATDADGTCNSDSLLVDINIAHVRSGSCPTDITNARVIGAEGNQHVKTGSFDSSTPILPVQKPSRPKPLLREKFRCVVPYPPQSEIELELKVGDVVYVHKKREDGWYKGTLQRTGKTGLFPGSFVEKVE